MTNPKATAAMQWNVHEAVRRSVNRGVSSAVELAAYRSFDHRALQDFLQETKSSWEGRG